MSASDASSIKLFPEPDPDDRSSYAHRQLIGCVGLLLPPLLWFMAGTRPTDPLPAWKPLGSISAYYYSGAVSAFTGGMIAMALFLFAYRGYENNYGLRDRVLSIIAGIAALAAAFFPTNAPIDPLTPGWWTPQMAVIHYFGGVFLFGSFACFALFQFPQSGKAHLPPDKRVRNGLYYACGAAIVLCMAWAAIAGLNKASIFWPETIALELFAVTWLVKGRAEVTAVAVGRKTLHYARHPGQLIDKARSAMRPKPGAGSMPPQNPA
jgi:hypothetical protein